jgi:hypothetical protein
MSKVALSKAKTNDIEGENSTFLSVTFANAVPGFIFAPPF